PNAAFSGSDSFTYTIIDGNGGSDTATVTITVNNENDAPDAVDDSASTDEDNAVTIDVLDNDSDLDGDDLTIDSVTDPANGVVTNNGTDVTYTPNADFNGVDSFTYTIGDGNGGSDTATVNVTVNPVNDVPVATDDAQSTAENTAVIIDVLANDSDADGDTLTVDSVTDPANGSVSNNGTDVTYTPDAAFSGVDTFEYTASDGNGGTATATVTVTVNNENDAPDAVDDSTTTDEDVAVIIDVLDNDSDLDGDNLTVDSVTDPANGAVFNNGTNVTYTPDADFNGADSFTYTIIDGNGGSNTATVNVTVNAVNDNPVAADDSQSTGENMAVTIDVLANDMDVDGDDLTIDSVTDPANGAVVNNGTDVTYTPADSFFGTDTFQYTVIDGNGGSATATVTVNVNDVNDAPVAVDDTASTDEGVAVTIDVLANDSDADGDTLTVDSVTDPANGVVVNNVTDVTYTPDAGFFGTDTFEYTVIDNNGGSDTATVTVTVNEVNAAPVATDDNATTDQDVVITIDVLANDTDGDGDTLAVESTTDPANGSVVNNGTDVTYTPDAGYFGTDTFEYTVTDNNGGTDTATVTVTVNEVVVGTEADLSISKTASSETVNVEEMFTYTIVVENSGPAVATAVNVSDTLPADVNFDAIVTSQGVCTEEDGDILCELGDIESGSAATVTIDVMADSIGELSNTATVTGSEADPDLTNNEDTAVVTVVEGFFCHGVPATIVGTEGDDAIRGTNGDDVIVALGGNDTIYGRNGNDIICGGEGSDTIRGGNGDDFLKGGRGIDYIWGDRNNDIIFGGRGADELQGNSGSDVIFGGRGADVIAGQSGNDILVGNRGDDYINGGSGNDEIYGGQDDDIIEGARGNDILIGNDGDDWLLGQNGNDYIEGNDGWDDLEGGSGRDELYGGNGYDLLFGGSSVDYCDGGAGFDEGFSCETEVDIP
ncbi:MAG: tandem-95 repeat protein, partial [Chloroflexota bacterium]